MLRLLALLSILFLFGWSVSNAHDVAIDDAQWLSGRWVGEGLGGVMEETWSTPAAGQMVGFFRLVGPDGKVQLYEMMLLDVIDDGLRLRVKHFDSSFVGWEQKDSWHLFSPVSVSPGLLQFNGLKLRRVSENEAEFVVIINDPNGVREETLRMRKEPM